MTPSHYLCNLRLPGRECVILWVSDDPDRLLEYPSGKVATFPTAEAARSFASANGLVVAPDPPASYDFAALSAWCDRPDRAAVDCAAFLNAWNLIGDLLGSPDPSRLYAHVDAHLTDVYDKLFWGNNLPSVTPQGKQFDPVWSEGEVTALSRLFRLGLQELTARLAA
jgi:hypothetical protein